MNYSPKSDEMVITVHRWFANKSCPGDWLYSRLGDLATKVTKQLGGSTSTSSTSSTSKTSATSKTDSKVKAWQHAMNVGFDTNVLVEDGIFGSACSAFAKSHTLYRGIKYNCPTAVRWLQKMVGAKVDGIFGAETERKVKEYQKKHNLTADGIVGLNTTKALLNV